MIDLVRQDIVKSAGRIVVKIGTNVLTKSDGTLDREHLAHLAEQVAHLRSSGRQVAIVSSGAVGAGIGKLKLGGRPATLPQLQAAAAVGQADLIDAYDASFRPHGFHAAQVLLTAEDVESRTRYLNCRNTLEQLLSWGAIPIINENDTVSTDEIRLGDNDRLAALVTNLLRAPLLVILSVVDGLYRGQPGEPGSELLDTVLDLNEEVLSLATSSRSGLGTGGMKTKLEAARIATSAGENVWIAPGRTSNVLKAVLNGERIGTLFPARGESMTAWKRWIGYTARPRGSYIVDEGAKLALVTNGRSLLPVGIQRVDGSFVKGDVVTIATSNGTVFARGLTNYPSLEAQKIAGRPTTELASLLGYAPYEEAVHRDNLVIL